MVTCTVRNLSYLRSRFCRSGVIFTVACMAIVMATATADAQKAKSKPTLVPGSEVSLSAVKSADWIQGEGPTAFEPGKIYVFECWATWCGPCVALIPHVNHLHKKYYDKGLRVHGMNCWEEEKEKAEKFVKAKGKGMSYPVAFTDGSAFQKEWLEAAGVEAIPHAFVVRNGKLLLATEAVRLTDSLVELMLSGDEGAKKAAAKIKAAYDARSKTEKLSQEIYVATRNKNAKSLEAKIKEVEALDPDHPELAVWKLRLLIVKQEWPAAIKTVSEMPAGNAKNSFLLSTGSRLARAKASDYPKDFIKSVTIPYSEYITEKGKAIGPNHFAYLSILYWRIDDKQTAIEKAEKGVEVAKNFARATEHRTNAFKRFAKSAKEGTMPTFTELTAWHLNARKAAAEAEKKTPPAKK